jgi:hypothetical protein
VSRMSVGWVNTSAGWINLDLVATITVIDKFGGRSEWRYSAKSASGTIVATLNGDDMERLRLEAGLPGNGPGVG